jgi:hypothetical protein
MRYIVVSLNKGRQVITYYRYQHEACRYAQMWEYRYSIPAWVETL